MSIPDHPPPMLLQPAAPDTFRNEVWSVVRLPLRVLLLGLAGSAVLGLAAASGVPGPASLAAALRSGDGGEGGEPAVAGLAALLIFGVGLAFAGFLWWLAGRTFALLRDPAVSPEQVRGLKDLPLALPEGTVRAVLALIVGVVGLPLLLFSGSLGVSDAVTGYVNGIITGVFGFYFGARATGGDPQAARRAGEAIASRERAIGALEAENRDLQQRAETAGADATRPSRLESELAKLERHIAAAEMLVETMGPALPAGLIPEGAAEALRRARRAAAGAHGLAAGEVTEETVSAVAGAAADLVSHQPLRALLQAATGLLPATAALGPGAAVAAVIGLGWHLGSAEYRRWRARVLAAPYEPRLIDLGLITPTSAELRMESSPIFRRAFATKRTEPGFFATLLDTMQRDDAAERLWAAYGADPRLFPGGRAELEAGLDEFRCALLADQAESDVTEEAAAAVAAGLVEAPPAFRATATPSPAELNRLLDAAGATADADTAQRAAFEALVMLTGTLRDRNIAPARLIAELAA